jgi:hypothetical protein
MPYTKQWAHIFLLLFCEIGILTASCEIRDLVDQISLRPISFEHSLASYCQE